jgi:hypothetical protein
MTRDHSGMKELRESFTQGALNKIGHNTQKIRQHLQLEFGLDTTDFKEVEVLSHFCSELYLDKLPISDEVVRILLRKLRKCQEILRKLKEASRQNKEGLVLISVQLHAISEALINIKRNATHLKYLTKDVNAIINETQSIKLLDEVVHISAVLNEPLIKEEATDPEEEEAKDPEDGETVDPDIYLEPESMPEGFELDNFNFQEFTPLPSRPELT